MKPRLRDHIGLVVILGVFLALGGLYLRVTPLLETPDEPSHFSVVKYIVDEGHLPPARPAPPDAGPVPVVLPGPPVYYAPPLYYLLGAPFISDLPTDDFAKGVIPNPNWARGWAPTPGRSPDNKNIYVMTTGQRSPLAGWAAAMIRLRILSLLLGAVTVSGTYVLARTLWPRSVASESHLPRGRFILSNQSWVLATTALVAFNPAFLFVTIGVTNDALLFALCAWAFALMARLVSRGANSRAKRRTGASSRNRARSWKWAALLGALLGLATVTKQSALAFLPVAALAVVWSAGSQNRSRRTRWIWVLSWAIPLILLGGWWYLHNTLTYHDPLGFQPHQIPGGEWTPSLSLLARQLAQALKGYWGAFGWGLILVEPVVYVALAAFAVIGVLGWLRRSTGDTGEQRRKQRRILVILVLGVLLNLIGLLLWLWRTSAPYGRLLFPTLGPLAALLVMGWQRWLGQRYSRPFAWAILLVFGLYAAIVPWRYLRPAYASPIVPASAARNGTLLDAQFAVNETNAESGQGHSVALRLLGYEVTPGAARPGDRVTLTLYWRATTPTADPLTVFVHVAPQDPEQRVAGVDDYLGTSRYPSDVWQPGETIRQVHNLRLSEDAPAPMVYWFSVGLYNPLDDQRLPVSASGVWLPEKAVRLGPLRVPGRDRWQPQQQVDFRLGSAVRLTGYDLDVSEDRSGESVAVTLYWQAVAAPEENLSVFVHLLDGSGGLVAQHDGPPRHGDYPTWAWQEGDHVPDTHTLVLPFDREPGAHRLMVGLYRPGDGTRIPILDAAGQAVPDAALLLAELDLP